MKIIGFNELGVWVNDDKGSTHLYRWRAMVPVSARPVLWFAFGLALVWLAGR